MVKVTTKKSTKKTPTKANKTKKGIADKINRKWLVIIVFALIGTFFTINSIAATSLKPVRPNSRFAWLLNGTPNETIMDSESGPKVYDFDYQNSSAAQIARMKAKGITTICYFSAGTDEDWRPDHSQFQPSDTFVPLPGWDGELIVDTRSANVRTIMANRIQTMNNLGCDGIEPDNIDAYTNADNLPLNETTTLDYMQFLTDTAHSYNMTIALKNAGDLVNKRLPNGKTVVEAHDFAVVEQCYEYQECDSYRPFITANKAVFIVEYKGSASTWAASASCRDANSKNYDAYLMNLGLNGPRTPCRTAGGDPQPPVNQPPAVNITSPTANQQFAAGSTVTLSANASDSDGSVRQVQFYNGTTSVAIDSATPYTTTISGLTQGTYNLRAVATDNAGGTNTTNLNITILAPREDPKPNVSPVVNLQTLPATIEAPGNFTLNAGASDQDGTIQRVEFYNGGTKLGEDLTSPYSFGIRNYGAGTYQFTAVAYDNAGASTTSNRVGVTITSTTTPVSNAPTWPNGATLRSGFHNSRWISNCAFVNRCKIFVNWTFATDNAGVTGYEVWRRTGDQSPVKLYVNAPDDPYFTDKIPKNKSYTYQVFAIDRDGNRTAGPAKTVKVSCTALFCSL